MVRHTLLPSLQVDIDLTPYKVDLEDLRRLKVEAHHARLATWETVSGYWSNQDLRRNKRLHILVRFPSRGECEHDRGLSFIDVLLSVCLPRVFDV